MKKIASRPKARDIAQGATEMKNNYIEFESSEHDLSDKSINE